MLEIQESYAYLNIIFMELSIMSPILFYAKSSSSAALDGRFRGNVFVARWSLFLKGTLPSPFNVLVLESNVLVSETLDSRRWGSCTPPPLHRCFWGGEKKTDDLGFCFRVKVLVFVQSSSVCGLAIDSTGTSFPPTWFVNTNVTWHQQQELVYLHVNRIANK